MLRASSSHRPLRRGALVALALALASGFGAFSIAHHAAAQVGSAVTADQVASLVQRFYDGTRDITARFHQTHFLKLYSRYDRSQGLVRFKRPGKMRWDYDAPNGQKIVSDGRRVVVYQPGDNGGAGQVAETELRDNQLPVALSFLTGSARLEENFTFRLLDAASQGFREGHVLELRPRAPSPHYDRVVLYVASAANVAGVVQRVLIIDPQGNRNRFDFRDLRFNRGLADAEFQWTPPAGTRRISP